MKESNQILSNLSKTIKQLKHLHSTSFDIAQEKVSELEKNESALITKLVMSFHEILSDKFNIKNQQNQKDIQIEDKENKNYWTFISKHFNTPVMRYCVISEKNGSNNDSMQKGKNWIRFSIMEKSFSDSIKEIYKQGLDEIYYEQNAILRKYKSEINDILKELEEIKFINILSKDYQKYLDFVKKGQNNSENKENNSDNELKLGQSPIPKKRMIKRGSIVFNGFFLNSNYDSDNSCIINQNELLEDEDYNELLNYDFDDSGNIKPINEESNEENDKMFTFHKFADFAPSIVNNFYTFNRNEKEKEKEKNENNSIINSIYDNANEEEINYSQNNKAEKRNKHGLALNPKKFKYLPTDNLYEISEKTLTKEYNKNDKLTYKKKKREISNSLLLYLNKYYKKTLFYKFSNHNLHNKPISLKQQNYQCYICHKKFSMIFSIPIDQVFWCSYYMRFVCKDCIEDEYFIIPYFILEKWCFEKFSISKQAKNALLNWYDKPIIYIKKTDKLLKKAPCLNKVIEIKKSINNIFDFMKCENKFKFVEETLGEYEYLALKEYIFSLRDLVEINKKIFYQKLKEFRNKFIKHISGECPECLFKGEICKRCGSDELIYFYDFENVFYCKICKKSFHRKCIGFVGHVH